MQFLDGQGQPFEVELRAVVKGSILQGALYLDESFFSSGFRSRVVIVSFF